jgi:hypothetical protein
VLISTYPNLFGQFSSASPPREIGFDSREELSPSVHL